jgi:hypothetical protein
MTPKQQEAIKMAHEILHGAKWLREITQQGHPEQGCNYYIFCR